MSSTKHPKAYVRVARPSEYAAIAKVLTRAFAQDPEMNWLGCVSEMVDSIDSPSPAAQQTMQNLSAFQSVLVYAILLINGLVTVVVIPRAEETQSEAEEEVVGVALWMPPGQTLNVNPLIFVRAGIMRVLPGFGLRGLKRVLLDFVPGAEGTLGKAFKERGMDRLDSWHMLEIVVDPAHQGQGYSSMLVQEGIQRASPKPVHTVITKASTRDIFLHFGFEVSEEHTFGVGAVDKTGITASGAAATGILEWVMTKWKTT